MFTAFLFYKQLLHNCYFFKQQLYVGLQHDTASTVEEVQYYRGNFQHCEGIPSSTVEDIQYCDGSSVLLGDIISTFGGLNQYYEGIQSVLWGIS